MSWEILSVLTGKVRPFRAVDEPSAIAKTPVDAPLAISPFGLAGDEQADPINHGGPDKAIHLYPADHYPFWRKMLDDHPLLTDAGAFGENISTSGLTEAEACLGDRFRMGTALLEISQGREPCWKLGHRFGIPTLPARVVATRRSGWYFRVLESGRVAAGDTLSLESRPLPQWSVERVFGLLIGGDYKRDPAGLRDLIGMQVLASPWRKRAVQLSAHLSAR